MSSNPLSELWKLHRIDAALTEIRKRAAALDAGQTIAAEIRALEAELTSGAGGQAREVGSKLQDFELKQRGIEEKLKKFDKELYGGQVVNPREVEAIQKEIAMLKKQRDTNDEAMLELMEAQPDAKKVFEGIEKRIDAKKAELAETRKRALAEKAKLEAEFAKMSAARGGAAKAVDPGLLARYETIRKRGPDVQGVRDGAARADDSGAEGRAGGDLRILPPDALSG